ncbi:MAG TPA: hypothetical protein VF188_02095 [Longimicrobiales bacterium]
MRGSCRPFFASLVALLGFVTAPLGAQMRYMQPVSSLYVAADSAAEELVIELRGVELPARAGHQDVRQPPAQMAEIPVEGWIHGFRVELVDGQGRPVPRAVLHHVNVITPDQRELFSPIMLRIAAAGQETAPAELPHFLGYPVERGQRLLVTAAFHNPTAQSYHDVTLRVRMPYTPADAWLDPVSIYPMYVDVMPPAGPHGYDLPPGHSEKSWEGSPAISGRILALGGHLHTYGVALRFEDVTEGKVLWNAEPIVDETGELTGMPMKRFLWRLGVPIRADHVYRLTAVYENPTGRTIPGGAMGALGGVFLPADDAAWPSADPEDPEYRLDVKTVMEGSYGHGAGAHVHHGM